MTQTVTAVSSARKIARYACEPRALNASSGPYAEEDRPSAPRPTQARNAARVTVWKIRGSMGSRAFPTRISLTLVGKAVGAPPARAGADYFFPGRRSQTM